MEEVILYVGGFELPDKNAAAQRVLANAKALRKCGCKVIFLNFSLDKGEKFRWTKYADFECYEGPKRMLLAKLTSNREAIQIIQIRQVSAVIAYNYPAVALARLIQYCRRKGIRCYADATEWYVHSGNIFIRSIKTLDTEWRMQKLHFKMDGVIAISEYLYQYYKDRVRTVKIPPLADIDDEKWIQVLPAFKTAETVFIYSGSPSQKKERLDLIIQAIECVSQVRKISLRVIGITQEQYECLYNMPYHGSAVIFVGRIPHRQAIQETARADWSIIIRDNNKLVQAGFPTKVTESISCGTPVVVNAFSNIMDYLNENNSVVCNIEGLPKTIERACDLKLSVDRNIFDYREYISVFKSLFADQKN